ncbi:hypothetical protein HK098_005260 [Nowakowskiella sp. JEL0407]|nr:hypothetical protein HK098_005260 [Nowakowskiella sp. JEL0407]
MSLAIPLELILQICSFLPPKLQYCLSVLLRNRSLQITSLPRNRPLSIKLASKTGNLQLLSLWREGILHIFPTYLNYYTASSINNASEFGLFDVLQWWLESGLRLKYTKRAMNKAIINGRVDVLNWWKNSGLHLKWHEYTIPVASMRNRVEILEWWVENKFPFDIQSVMSDFLDAIYVANSTGNIQILNLWCKLGMRFEHCNLNFLERSMIAVAKTGNVDVLQWWFDFADGWNSRIRIFRSTPQPASLAKCLNVLEWISNHDLSYKTNEAVWVFRNAAKIGDVRILNWWIDRGLKLDWFYLNNVLDDVSIANKVDILNWMVKAASEDSDAKLVYSEKSLDGASDKGHVEILQWWKDSGLKLKWTAKAIESASRQGHVEVLDWWLRSGLELRYTEQAILSACHNGKVSSLEWWQQSGLPLKYNNLAIGFAFEQAQLEVLKWWKDSGIEIRYNKTGVIDYALRSVNGRLLEVAEWWVEESGWEFDCWNYTARYLLHPNYGESAPVEYGERYFKLRSMVISRLELDKRDL